MEEHGFINEKLKFKEEYPNREQWKISMKHAKFLNAYKYFKTDMYEALFF